MVAGCRQRLESRRDFYRFRRRSRPLLIGRTGRSEADPVLGFRFAGLPDTFGADLGFDAGERRVIGLVSTGCRGVERGVERGVSGDADSA